MMYVNIVAVLLLVSVMYTSELPWILDFISGPFTLAEEADIVWEYDKYTYTVHV